jgi:hypothetical protein
MSPGDLLVGLIGRPILAVIKWFRWYFLGAGLYFNTMETYDPVSRRITSSEFTVIPALIGIVLFSVGLTVKRYDEMQRDFIQACKDWGRE